MPLISDKEQVNLLKKNNINIKTKYIVGNKILERNTNNSYNDDIDNGVRLKKEYYINDKLVHTETKFDTRMEYTFISLEEENKEYNCPNCGHHAKIKDFVDGCPYCGTYYNVDYTSKDLGSKYHYDRVLRSTKYRIITAIIDYIISTFLCFIFIKTTSRTFNSFDIGKIFIYGGILSLILYYFFYVVDAYVVLGPIKAYKDAQNQKQIDFWNRTKIDKKSFYNNLNYELRNKYYTTKDVIDYDIIDFDEFIDYKEKNMQCVKIKAYVRVVKYVNGKIESKYMVDEYIMKKVTDDTLELKAGENIIMCPGCGASIDATKGACSYCGNKIKALTEWMLVK